MRLIISWALNALALMGVAYLLPGVQVDGFVSALIAALVLGLVNTLIKPLIVLLTLPLTILTLGLFYVLINGLMFLWVGSVLAGFQVHGVLTAVIAAVLYSALAGVLTSLVLKNND